MKCTKCGFENEDGAAFCGGCGEDLSSENIMNTLDENAKKTEKKPKKNRKAKKEKAPDAEKALKRKRFNCGCDIGAYEYAVSRGKGVEKCADRPRSCLCRG